MILKIRLILNLVLLQIILMVFYLHISDIKFIEAVIHWAMLKTSENTFTEISIEKDSDIPIYDEILL